MTWGNKAKKTICQKGECLMHSINPIWGGENTICGPTWIINSFPKLEGNTIKDTHKLLGKFTNITENRNFIAMANNAIDEKKKSGLAKVHNWTIFVFQQRHSVMKMCWQEETVRNVKLCK